jgi:NAD(P)-dependent dehydrogenase (short-subunit alcohol dehydrogenase family)
VKGSVSDLADLDRLYAAVKAERGTLDIVFANAGSGAQNMRQFYYSHRRSLIRNTQRMIVCAPGVRRGDPAALPDYSNIMGTATT